LASRMFNPRYSFENFVIGAGNQFAHAASQAAADTPGRRYNPLFIYGGVGLGKTHLLNAVGHRIIKNRTVSDPTKVCYISSEEFTNELVNSIRFERMDGFRKKFRNTEVLLIDDIQFISGKERTQIEFFHTFNSLYENKKQIVLTSDKLPREIPDFEERLKSRFEWGLIADIQAPDVETKVAILKKKSDLENIYIPNDVAFFLASNINSNVRILEGCLIRLGAFSSLTKQEINLEMAKEVLKNFIRDKEATVTIDSIQRQVSSYFDLKPKDLRSKRRLKQFVVPRQIGMYLSRKLTPSSLIEIGGKFGGKDHSTVIHAINKIEEKVSSDTYTKNVVADLIKKISE
jgi:chromosomal replication initiator protein